MSQEKDKKVENIEDKDIPIIKASRKEKKASRKKSKNYQENIKVVPLLKPPRRYRKSEKDIIPKSQTGIIWDDKTIEEHYLDRKLHPRIKIDEPKTKYPYGDKKDAYEDGINKVNEIKPTKELLNEVVESLKDNDFRASNNKELIKRAYSNDYTNALKCYSEDLSGEIKICLKNTLINKFHKEVRSLSIGKNF